MKILHGTPTLAVLAALALAAPAAATTTTVTTTTLIGTTTTTLAGPPSFSSVDASIMAMEAQLGGAARAKGQTSMLHQLGRAQMNVEGAETLFNAGNRRKASTLLHRANRALIEFGIRLHSLTTRRRMNADLRASLLAATQQTRTELQTLMKSINP